MKSIYTVFPNDWFWCYPATDSSSSIKAIILKEYKYKSKISFQLQNGLSEVLAKILSKAKDVDFENEVKNLENLTSIFDK